MPRRPCPSLTTSLSPTANGGRERQGRRRMKGHTEGPPSSGKIGDRSGNDHPGSWAGVGGRGRHRAATSGFVGRQPNGRTFKSCPRHHIAAPEPRPGFRPDREAARDRGSGTTGPSNRVRRSSASWPDHRRDRAQRRHSLSERTVRCCCSHAMTVLSALARSSWICFVVAAARLASIPARMAARTRSSSTGSRGRSERSTRAPRLRVLARIRASARRARPSAWASHLQRCVFAGAKTQLRA